MPDYSTPPFSFNDTESLKIEKETFSDQLDEICLMYGSELKYIDVTHAQPDYIFGEYLANTIEKGLPLRLYTEGVEDDFYIEDGGMFSKFGYTPQLDSASFWGSVNYFNYLDIVPQEDDLIYYIKTQKLFEITKITKIDGYKYRIDVRLYNYSHEEVDSEVDDLPILEMEDINDEEIIKIKTPIVDQVENNDIIDDSVPDGLYD